MKFKLLILFALLLFTVPQNCQAQGIANAQLEDISVIVIVTDGVGYSYFEIKELMESWGCNVTTAGLEMEVTACPNRDPIPVSADILVENMSREMISEYDCVIIPSGGNWPILSTHPHVNELVSTAYEEGLVVGSLCIGLVPLARMDNLLNGTKVVSFVMSNSYVRNAGGIPVSGVRVISDKRVVSGGAGGGLQGGGYTAAPIREFCTTIVKEVLEYSHLAEITVEQLADQSGEYSIRVGTADFIEMCPGVNCSDVSEVTAFVHQRGNATNNQTVELFDEFGNGTYTGTFTQEGLGTFDVDVEIEDEDRILEVIRNATSLNIEMPPGDYTFYLVIGGIGLAALVVVFLARRR
ncbi:MAG: DJ-1/PfpI family protein [Candidatus Thorarchaeota archaeon]|nr:MAG: DJ-1/PfpI family protein [Candidatus Thorarchaeota archaeon]